MLVEISFYNLHGIIKINIFTHKANAPTCFYNTHEINPVIIATTPRCLRFTPLLTPALPSSWGPALLPATPDAPPLGPTFVAFGFGIVVGTPVSTSSAVVGTETVVFGESGAIFTEVVGIGFELTLEIEGGSAPPSSPLLQLPDRFVRSDDAVIVLRLVPQLAYCAR